MARSVVILGTQWGDEGKGKIVDLLARDADAVVRFQGGHNAGHTLLVGGRKTVLHLIPSGILTDRARCLVGNGVVIAPDALLTEIEGLAEAGIGIDGRLGLSGACPVILASHVALDRARERARGRKAIGTTGRGIGPVYEDKASRLGIRLADIADPARLEDKLGAVLDYHNFLLVHYYQAEPLDPARVADDAARYGELLKPMLCDVAEELHGLRRAGRTLLFEGAQGSLLDIDHGTYPFVTSSNTTVGGRPRRCGWLDAVALKRMVRINGISGLCVTKLDVLDGLDTVRICVAYEGVENFPQGAEEWAHARPVYRDVPGWSGDCRGITDANALPAAARAYLDVIAELVEAPVHMLSTGPEREANVIYQYPFGA